MKGLGNACSAHSPSRQVPTRPSGATQAGGIPRTSPPRSPSATCFPHPHACAAAGIVVTGAHRSGGTRHHDRDHRWWWPLHRGRAQATGHRDLTGHGRQRRPGCIGEAHAEVLHRQLGELPGQARARRASAR